MSLPFRLAAFSALVIGAAGPLAIAGEETLDVAAAPAAVRAAVKRAVGAAKIDAFSKEDEDGKTTYEVAFKAAGTDRSTKFAADGKVLEEEETLKAADVPSVVKDAVAKAVPAGKLGEVGRVRADGKTFYEADVVAGSERRELKISADGAVLSNKIEDDDDDHDEKSDHKDVGHEAKR